MRTLWRIIFSTFMLAVTLGLLCFTYGLYAEGHNIFAAFFGFLVIVGLFHTIRGPKKRSASSSRRRRKALIKFDDVDQSLYDQAQNLPTNYNAAPTKAQIRLAESIGISLPDHITASTAMDIIDDAIEL